MADDEQRTQALEDIADDLADLNGIKVATAEIATSLQKLEALLERIAVAIEDR
jgi:hypothetical protein